MKLEETIQMCFDKHPASFENRKQVLLHLFCLYGNGFEWKNGELINRIDEWDKFEGKLDKNGKAKQWKSFNEVTLRFLYDSIAKSGDLKTDPVPFEKFVERMEEVKKLVEAKGTTLEETFLKESIYAVNSLRGSHEKYLIERMSRKHSHIFTAPKDIKKDWAEGINEVKGYLKELNIDLEEIR